MQTTVSKSQFKPKALEYLRLVEKLDQTLTITHAGKPVVQVVPYETSKNHAQKLLGTVIKYEDPAKPVSENVWEAMI